MTKDSLERYGLGAITKEDKYRVKVYYADKDSYHYLKDKRASSLRGGPLSKDYTVIAPTTLWRW